MRKNLKEFFQLLYLMYFLVFFTFIGAGVLRILIPGIPKLFKLLVTETLIEIAEDPMLLFWLVVAFLGLLLMFWVMGPEQDYRGRENIRRGRTLGNLDDLQRQLRSPLSGESYNRERRMKERRRS